MNPYNFSILLFAFGSFFLGLFVWLKRQDQVGKIYLAFEVFCTIWGIGTSILFSQSSSYTAALYGTRIAHFGSLFIPVTWFHLTLSFSGRVTENRKLLIGIYIITAFIEFFVFSSLFIPTVEPAVGFKYYTRFGPVYHSFVGLFFIVVTLGFVQLARKIGRSTGEEKLQTIGFFIAALAGFTGGALTFLPGYDIMIPQYGAFLLPVYPFVMGYFMIRHHLFDLEQIAQAFQREKLATIGLLAASINHEIRNPLYAAKGLLETYIENKKDNLPTRDSLEISEKALSQLNRALDVIGKLNRFAKPANQNGQHARASIPEAIQTVVDLVSYEFKLDQIDIVNEINSSLPMIEADQRQLEEIFFNLVANACHAMPEGGRLEISAQADYHKVKVSVSDTGLGIPSGQLAHIFEPFYTTKGEAGTGLGLYVTKQLIQKNNGKLSVESQEGKGTTFLLEFPKA